MRNAILLFSLVLLSCNAAKKPSAPTMITLISDCPKNGTCSLDLLKDKSMLVKTDEWGRFYYELIDDPGKNVIQFQYNKTVKGDLQDASYREEVVMEWNGDMKPSSGAELQTSKLLFGRFCFCRGQTGTYKISQGNLTIDSAEKEKKVTLTFRTDEVPQIINSVSFTLK